MNWMIRFSAIWYFELCYLVINLFYRYRLLCDQICLILEDKGRHSGDNTYIFLSHISVWYSYHTANFHFPFYGEHENDISLKLKIWCREPFYKTEYPANLKKSYFRNYAKSRSVQSFFLSSSSWFVPSCCAGTNLL